MRSLVNFCRYTKKLELSFQKSIGKPQISGRNPLALDWATNRRAQEEETKGFHKLLDIECMQSLLTSREMPPGERSPPTLFYVAVMYEDPGTRKQAKKGLNYVAEVFGSDFEIRHLMWRLDILQNPKLSVRAAPSLAKSDLLMISLHGGRRLSAKIRKLVDEQLLQTVNHGSALLALFEGGASATRSPLHACLSTLAEERGLDFLEQAINDGEDQEKLSLKLVWVF